MAESSQEAKVAVLERTVEIQQRELRDLWRELKEAQLRHDEKLETINKNVADLVAQFNQAQGSWKTLMVIGGASATFGGLVVAALDFFKK